MEIVLHSRLSNPSLFLQQFLGKKGSDLEIGLLFGLAFSDSDEWVLVLKCLLRALADRVELRDCIFEVFFKVLQKEVGKITESHLKSFVKDLAEILENAAGEISGFGQESLKNRESLKASYDGIKKKYSSHLGVIKFIQIGKRDFEIFKEVSDEVLTLDEISKLVEIVEQSEITEGISTLKNLLLRLKTNHNECLLTFSVNCLKYLLEQKAQKIHMKDLSSELIKNHSLFSNQDKEKLLSSYSTYEKRISSGDYAKIYRVFKGLDPAEKHLNFLENEAEPAKLENEISEIVKWASFLFLDGQKIDQNELKNKFKPIQEANKPDLFFNIFSEMIYYDEPGAENARFWETFLPVLEEIFQSDQRKLNEIKRLLKNLEGSLKPNPGLKQAERRRNFGRNPKKVEEKSTKKPVKIDLMSEEYKELSNYISKISEDCLVILREHSITQSRIDELNEAIRALKSVLKSYSLTSRLGFIGSGPIGTSLKESSTDLILTDKENDIKSYIFSAFPNIKQKSEFIYVLKLDSPNICFNIHIENKFQIEITSLIKKYCSIDPRVTKLIMVLKLWAYYRKLWMVSGLEWSIVALVFLLNTDPPVIPNLQSKEHREKIINEFDVWFDCDYSAKSNNIWTIGQLIYHFFYFFYSELGHSADLKIGKFVESCSRLEVFHPFTGQLISKALEAPDYLLIDQSFKETFEMVLKNEPLDKVLNLIAN